MEIRIGLVSSPLLTFFMDEDVAETFIFLIVSSPFSAEWIFFRKILIFWDILISYFLRGAWDLRGVLLHKEKIYGATLKGLFYFCFDDENYKMMACGAILSTFSTVNL